MEGGDLSTLLESHFHNDQDCFFFFLKEMPEDLVFILKLIANEMATDAAGDLVHPWVGNADAMDA